jgi:hypothetical protein
MINDPYPDLRHGEQEPTASGEVVQSQAGEYSSKVQQQCRQLGAIQRGFSVLNERQ